MTQVGQVATDSASREPSAAVDNIAKKVTSGNEILIEFLLHEVGRLARMYSRVDGNEVRYFRRMDKGEPDVSISEEDALTELTGVYDELTDRLGLD